MQVAIIGAGPLGRRLALAAARAGYEVLLEDVMPSNLHHAQEYLRQELGPEALPSVRLVSTIEEAVREADLAIDCVPDELESKLAETMDTQRQNAGEVSSATVNAQAQVKATQAALAQAEANLAHQQADTTRTVALAKQGIASAQARDEAETALNAADAAVQSVRANVAAAEAAVQQAKAHELLAQVSAKTVASTRGMVQNAKALADQASVQLGYAKVYAPVSGPVNVLAARQGEVLTAGGTIATIMDLSQTWVYAPLPETQADVVKLGDELKVVMPSGESVQGKVIAKSAEADFATQRDINGGRKRDIKTVRLKLLIPNPGEKFVPGMTADVFIPRDKLVKQ
jgi:HlyD family secretion protein